MPHAIPTYNIFNLYPTSRNYNIHGSWVRWWLMDVHVLHCVGLIWGNNHMWKRVIDAIQPMWIVIYPERTVDATFGSTAHLFIPRVRNLCCEQRIKGIIGNDYHKLGKIP